MSIHSEEDAAPHTKDIAAFTAEHVSDEARVLCLEFWDPYLLAGLSDGTLLLLTDRAGSSPGDSVPPTQWAVVQALRGFGSGRVAQLAVARGRGLLLCLSGDGVNAYTLPGLRLRGRAPRSTGAACFAWDEATEQLCVAVKRRLLLYRLDGLELVVDREVALPGTAVCMCLAQRTAYVGLGSNEYVAVDIQTLASTQLFATHGSAPCLASVPPNEAPLAPRRRGGVADQVVGTARRAGGGRAVCTGRPAGRFGGGPSTGASL